MLIPKMTPDENGRRPWMNDLGYFDGTNPWLVSYGDFPFDTAVDKTTSRYSVEAHKADWARRQEQRERANRQRQALGQTWEQYYQADR